MNELMAAESYQHALLTVDNILFQRHACAIQQLLAARTDGVRHSPNIPEDTTVRLPVDRALTTTVLLLTYVNSKLPLYLQVRSSGCDYNSTHGP
jgi:hypothetical protein